MLTSAIGWILCGAIASWLHLGVSPDQPAGWVFSILSAVLFLSAGAMSTHAWSPRQ